MINTKLNGKILAEKSLFLHERLLDKPSNLPFSISTEEEQLINERFDLWQRKAGGNGGEQAFHKRIAAESLFAEQVKGKLGPVTWKMGANLPKWVDEIEEVLSVLPTTVASLEKKLHNNLSQKFITEHVYTYAALLPFLYYAEKKMLIKLGKHPSFINDSAMTHFLELLAKSLHFLLDKTLLLEFQQYISAKNPLHMILGNLLTKEEQATEWDTFLKKLLAGEWINLITKYPVLARLMCQTIKFWFNNIEEFAQHLNDDKQQLQITFNGGKKLGHLTKVEGDISDAHNKGKSVFVLTFSTGVKIVYKPRSLQIDESWSKWIDYMECNGLPYPLFTPKVIDRQYYGWMEFVEHQPLSSIDEAHTYYFRAGVLLGTVYAFGGNDFHYENIIACGDHPVLIDTETLFLHKVKPFEWKEHKRTASQIVNDMMEDSVVRTGMLPLWRSYKNGKALDSGGFTGKLAGKLNLPIYENKTLHAKEYKADLLAGVKWVYSFIAKNKQKLLEDSSLVDELFGDCKFRFLIRNSQVYGDMLEHTVKPQFLQDGLYYSFEIERLAAAFLLYAPDEKIPELWNIFISERNALEERDIPIFYGKAKELTIRDGTQPLYDQYFMKSAISNAKSLMERMSDKDETVQVNLIKLSLSMQQAKSHMNGTALSVKAANITKLPADDKLLLQESKRIYDELMKHRIKANDNDFTWLVRQFDLKAEKITIGKIGLSFYDGTIGIGLFMAALYRITKDETVKNSALATIHSLRESLHSSYNPLPIRRFPLGLGSGVAGIIRGLMMMSYYLNDESLLNDARTIAQKVEKAQIDEDKLFDLLGGSAGLIVVLIELYERTRNDELIHLACLCGEHLLRNRVTAKSGQRVWTIGIEKEPLTGLGHGAAGYAYALYKLAMVTKEAKFEEAAFEALDYENGLYSKQHNNWPDLRKNPHATDHHQLAFMEGWCSGAPGVGLARIGMLQDSVGDDAKQFHKDIERAVQFTIDLSDMRSDHVCCGHAGTLDLLIEASLAFNKPEWMAIAKEKAGMMVGRRRNNDHFLLNSEDSGAIYDPSFFQGNSGIGYQLLRCIKPNEIMSVIK